MSPLPEELTAPTHYGAPQTLKALDKTAIFNSCLGVHNGTEITATQVYLTASSESIPYAA